MANPTQEDEAWLSGKGSIVTRLDKAIVVRLGEKRLLRAAITHAEGLQATEEAASEREKIVKKRPREETKPAGGSGKRMKR